MGLKTLDELAEVSCLLALGDPGLGKSWEIGEYATRLKAKLDATAGTGLSADETDALLAFDATEFESTDALRARVFGDPAFTRWRSGSGLLYLVIDSLDEARVDRDLLSGVLLDELESAPVERLRLRIACRTAVFPQELRDGLRRRFSAADRPVSDRSNLPDSLDRQHRAAGLDLELGEDLDDEAFADALEDSLSGDLDLNGTARERTPDSQSILENGFVEVELAILTRAEARAAAVARLRSEDAADRFLEAVANADAVAFAARPQTLSALLGRYVAGDSLAGSQEELFRALCLTLCDPHPVQPHTAGVDTRLSLQERYRLASRLSAAMLLGNRPTLSLISTPAADEGVLDVTMITGVEHIRGVALRVTESALWEAVNTALFTATTEATGLVAHLTFTEFLAADWLTSNDLPLAQIVALLTDPADPERRVVPQLRQVAAWLAAMRMDVFEEIARAEPDIVLWSDVVQLPEARRPGLVDALLIGMTGNRILNPPFGMPSRLERLKHPGLADQLAPVIADSSLPERTRDLAIDIARSTEQAQLAPLAASLALDESESIELRALAARLVADVGAEEDRWELMTLAACSPEGDEADDLKGAALRACWSLFTPDELFAVLTSPKRPNYSGAYSYALHEIAKGLTSEYARAGAAWLAHEEHRGAALDFVTLHTIRLALTEAADPVVLNGLAEFASRRIAHYEGLLEDTVGNDDLGISRDLDQDAQLRHRLVAAIIGLHPGGRHNAYVLTQHSPRLFGPDDVEWGIAQLTSLPSADPRREGWRDLIHWSFTYERDHVMLAFAHRTDPDVATACNDLTSQHSTADDALAAVAAARRREERRRAVLARRSAARLSRRDTQHQPVAPGTLATRLEEAMLAQSDATTPWVAVIRELLRMSRVQWATSLDTNRLIALRSLRGTPVGERVVAAAAHFLATAQAPEKPYPDGRVLWSSVFGVVAAVTLLELSPEILQRVSADTWARWMPAIAGYLPDRVEEHVHEALMRSVASAAPDAARDAFVQQLDSEAKKHHGWFRETVVNVALTVPGVDVELARRVGRGEYTSESSERVLDELLARASASGMAAARRLLRALRPPRGIRRTATTAGDEQTRQRGLAAAAALFAHVPTVAYRLLWPHLLSSDDTAKEFFRFAAQRREAVPPAALEQLTDEQLANLFLLLLRLFPPEGDPWHVGVFSPGPRDNLTRWRGSLLRALESRRTPTAVGQIERIARQEPPRDYLVQAWLQALAALRSERWQGTAPADVVRLAERSDLRLVESSAQLLDVIIESLTRLQGELQGEWRSVVNLWNEAKSGNEPKSEEHLSQEVARHLKRDLKERGVVVGRELQIQMLVHGGAGGLRTDIDVQAPTSSVGNRSVELPRAIIEVKGSWNPEVPSAMQEQLVDRYLDPQHVRAGLFLVGYFTCKSWVKGRRYRESCRRGSQAELEAMLRQQAAGLTNAMRVVRACVLNTSLPDSSVGKRAARRSRRRKQSQ